MLNKSQGAGLLAAWYRERVRPFLVEHEAGRVDELDRQLRKLMEREQKLDRPMPACFVGGAGIGKSTIYHPRQHVWRLGFALESNLQRQASQLGSGGLSELSQEVSEDDIQEATASDVDVSKIELPRTRAQLVPRGCERFGETEESARAVSPLLSWREES